MLQFTLLSILVLVCLCQKSHGAPRNHPTHHLPPRDSSVVVFGRRPTRNGHFFQHTQSGDVLRAEEMTPSPSDAATAENRIRKAQQQTTSSQDTAAEAATVDTRNRISFVRLSRPSLFSIRGGGDGDFESYLSEAYVPKADDENQSGTKPPPWFFIDFSLTEALQIARREARLLMVFIPAATPMNNPKDVIAEESLMSLPVRAAATRKVKTKLAGDQPTLSYFVWATTGGSSEAMQAIKRLKVILKKGKDKRPVLVVVYPALVRLLLYCFCFVGFRISVLFVLFLSIAVFKCVFLSALLL